MTTTMEITLTPAQQSHLQSMVDAGYFQTPEEAVVYSINTLVFELTPPPEYSPEAFAHLDKGIAQLRRGDFVSQAEVEVFFDDWRKDLAR